MNRDLPNLQKRLIAVEQHMTNLVQEIAIGGLGGLESMTQKIKRLEQENKVYPVYQNIDELIQNIHQILNILHKGETILKDHAVEAESLYVNYFRYL